MTIEHKDFSKEDTYITKGCAILLLLFHHIFYNDWLVETTINYTYIFPNLTKTISKYGYICIFIFSSLTGYGLQKNKNKSIKELIVKNEAKLLGSFIPVYILCSLLFVFVNKNGLSMYIEMYGDYNFVCKFFEIIIDMCGFSKILNAKTINASWWYMSAAHLIILILPVLIKVNEKYKTQKILFILLFIYCGMHSHQSSPFCCCLLSAYIGYMLGESNYFLKISKSADLKIASLSASLLLPLLSIFLMEKFNGYFLFACFGGISFMTFVYFFVSRLKCICVFLKKIGKISNIIYMTHTFVVSLVLPISNYIYGFQYAIEIYVIFLLVIYLLSFLIDFIVKTISFDKKVASFLNRVLC